MKKTLEEFKEIVANQNNFDSWDIMILYSFKGTIIMFTDLANKMYYEQSGWVGVEDEQPDNNKDVLLADNESGIINIGFFSFDAEGFIPSSVMTVTHWQPLPKQP